MGVYDDSEFSKLFYKEFRAMVDTSYLQLILKVLNSDANSCLFTFLLRLKNTSKGG